MWGVDLRRLRGRDGLRERRSVCEVVVGRGWEELNGKKGVGRESESEERMRSCTCEGGKDCGSGGRRRWVRGGRME